MAMCGGDVGIALKVGSLSCEVEIQQIIRNGKKCINQVCVSLVKQISVQLLPSFYRDWLMGKSTILIILIKIHPSSDLSILMDFIQP